MERLEAHSVSIRVPAGWEAELSTQEDPATIDDSLAPSEISLVVLHAANFALPPDRDDYGTEVVQSLGSGGIFMSLIEFARASASSRLFTAQGVPTLNPDDFAPEQLLRLVGSQSGLQRFFRVGGRAFCLYTVIGSHPMRRVLVAEANRVLSGLSID